MRNILFASLVIASLSAFGCAQPKPAEGPAERAGKSVDNAAEKTKDAAKDAAESTKDTAQDAKKKVEGK